MKEEQILSAGIDIGTTTTQLIFSRLTIQNTAGFGRIPQTEITDKKILYRSPVYFTPLLNETTMNGKAIRDICEQEYRSAGIRPSDVSTGAVIITGESVKKQNARQVADAISTLAGNFVVSSAGPDLESILAGKGSGAAALSRKTGKIVANLDIGGGTTNICYFEDGEVVSSGCLDIGGRMIQVRDGRISAMTEKCHQLLSRHHMICEIGDVLSLSFLQSVCRLLADLCAASVGWAAPDHSSYQTDLDFLRTSHLPSASLKPDLFTFSGGVASCMEESYSSKGWDRYGDIGPLLAAALKAHPFFLKEHTRKAAETMRATVIGAGNYSTTISGSTISYTVTDFPVRNLPIGKILLRSAADLSSMELRLQRVLTLLQADTGNHMAVAFQGIPCPSFLQIQEMAGHIMKQYETCCPPDTDIIIITEADIGKALGQALRHINSHGHRIICLDHIRCESGDYIDLGIPVANGTVIPVIVKTMVFQDSQSPEITKATGGVVL